MGVNQEAMIAMGLRLETRSEKMGATEMCVFV